MVFKTVFYTITTLHLVYILCQMLITHIPLYKNRVYYALRFSRLVDEISLCTVQMKKSFYTNFFRIFKIISQFHCKMTGCSFKLREKFTKNLVSLIFASFTKSKVPFESFETLKRIDDILKSHRESKLKLKTLCKNVKELVFNLISVSILCFKLPMSQKRLLFMHTNIPYNCYKYLMLKMSWCNVILAFRVLRKLDDIMVSCMTIRNGYVQLRKCNNVLVKGIMCFRFRLLYVLVFFVSKVMKKMSEILGAVVKISKVMCEGSRVVLCGMIDEKKKGKYGKKNN